jgi:hypothetical protein
MTSPWTDLARRAGEASGADRDLDAAIFEAMGWPRNPKSPLFVKDPGDDIYCRSAELSSSVDLVLVLISEKLPGQAWKAGETMARGGGYWAQIEPDVGDEWHTGGAVKPALALLAAFCLAMAAKAGEREGVEA